ncbi:MAG: lipoate--protein ligase [Oscillospiraceae bacterium]|jgi:lipoate-protein ligase A|nr:lipoate--protein ligase [Oscillospiraceae bacterium]
MIIFETNSTDPCLNFAAEEFLTRQNNEAFPVWLFWYTEKCVMLGQNQLPEAELDIAAANACGVQIVRRQSGGGCIYTDPGTLQYSIILPFPDGGDVSALVSEHAAEPVVNALCKLGVPVEFKGRNDIEANGKKISGLAAYVLNGKLVVHGSLLFSTDLDILERLLSPDVEKISTKALRSVRSRVGLISEYIPLNRYTASPWNISDFKRFLQDAICGKIQRTRVFTAEDYAQIKRLRNEKYAHTDWIFRRAPAFSRRDSRRFPGGRLDAFLTVSGGLITGCSICGDFLSIVEMSGLEEKIRGLPYRRDAVENALNLVDITPFLGGVTRDELILCMF